MTRRFPPRCGSGSHLPLLRPALLLILWPGRQSGRFAVQHSRKPWVHGRAFTLVPSARPRSRRGSTVGSRFVRATLYRLRQINDLRAYLASGDEARPAPRLRARIGRTTAERIRDWSERYLYRGVSSRFLRKATAIRTNGNMLSSWAALRLSENERFRTRLTRPVHKLSRQGYEQLEYFGQPIRAK